MTPFGRTAPFAGEEEYVELCGGGLTFLVSTALLPLGSELKFFLDPYGVARLVCDKTET